MPWSEKSVEVVEQVELHAQGAGAVVEMVW